MKRGPLVHRTLEEWFALAREQEVRFWSKVDKNGPCPPHRLSLGPCWLWTAHLDKDGYGTFMITAPSPDEPKQKAVRAHRMSWQFELGLLPEGAALLHACDVPHCVNRSHLFRGTQADNMADMVAKGRHLTGERNPSAVLTEPLVMSIRARHAAGESASQLQQELGVGYNTIVRVINRTIWKHVP